MTIGIYELKFTDGSTYIGQSINISKRLSRHLLTMGRGDHHNRLVQSKFNTHGSPVTSILEECAKEELCDKEVYYASLVPKDLLLNLSEPGQKTTTLHGILNGRSKYPKEDVLDILFALAHSDISKKELAEISPISYTMIRQISAGAAHVWLKNEYPVEWEKMQSKTKKKIVHKVRDPLGVVHEVISQRSFVTNHNISLSSLNHLITGKVESAKGWTLIE